MKKLASYLDIAQDLRKYYDSQQGILKALIENTKLVGEISNAGKLGPLFSQLDEINALKSLLPRFEVETPMLELVRGANEAISKLSLSNQMGQLFNENISISELWKGQMAGLHSVANSIGPELIEIQSQVAHISEISILAERILSHIDLSNLFSESRTSDLTKALAGNMNSAFLESYSNLFKSLNVEPLGILSYPPVVSTAPPVEFYLNARLIRPAEIDREESVEDISVSRELTDKTVGGIEFVLGELDPALVGLWKGARVAQNSTQPDAARHFAISLRELLMYVIHKLSPDARVAAWTTNPNHFHNGRPTRKTRLLYICKNSNQSSFNEFLEKDIDAVLACIRVFEEGAHALAPSFSGTQLDLLLSRVESAIRFLIRTNKETGGTD